MTTDTVLVNTDCDLESLKISNLDVVDCTTEEILNINALDIVLCNTSDSISDSVLSSAL